LALAEQAEHSEQQTALAALAVMAVIVHLALTQHLTVAVAVLVELFQTLPLMGVAVAVLLAQLLEQLLANL
jgi:uncharacterized membrane protein YagU involved in acid resistance